MSRIVKSMSVVDDRARMSAHELLPEIDRMPVIKPGAFSYHHNLYSDETLFVPDKNGYLDELNRIRVEIAEAKNELRKLKGKTEEALIEQEREKERLKLEKQEREEARQREIALSNVPAAKEEAARILAESQESAAAMILQAEAEGSKIKEDAQSHGYLEGFEKGFKQATDEFTAENNPKMKGLDDLLEELSNYREEMIARNEKDLLDVVFTVAEKIVGYEIKSEPRTVASMLYKTLDDNRREEYIRITISPDLMPVDAKISEEIKQLIISAAPQAMLYIESDESDGTCYVETDKGITDLSVKTQLNNARKLLEDDQYN
ncbi:MAG: FliH/SctL family protein [Oscillospiraceae bacterium]|nr:FliH/SctL family protein [Oscillospiraceae bacterium]